MRKIFGFSALMIFIFAHQAFSCFNPTDFFAVEVVLNKSGIDYNLDLIKSANNLVIDEGTLIYQSHFDNRVASILEQVKVEYGNGKMLKGLSVKLQIPTKKVIVDDSEDLVEAVDIRKDEFDFKSAMKIELDWLKENGIIVGISNEDIATISAVSKAGLAGWNSRIIYDEKWVSFAESGDGSFIDRANNCGGFEIINIPNGEIILPVTGITRNSKIISKWGEIKLKHS